MNMKPSNKQLSRGISDCLEQLGFGKLQRWERIHHQNIQTRVKNTSIKLCIHTNNERVFVGSQQEGIGLLSLSDMDVLQLEHDVICAEETSVPNDNRLAFRIDESNAPHGYCCLELGDSIFNYEAVKRYQYALVERNDKVYLSSKLFLTKIDDDNLKVSEYMKHNTSYYPQKGPSTPKSVSTPLFSACKSYLSWLGVDINDKIDFVRAFPCDGVLALKSWQQRHRLSWPSKKMIRHIMTLPVYVVPVGLHGTNNEDIQWRISFVRAETYLVKALNTVQTHILVLLKFMGKHNLKEGCPCITSYIFKNVIFWLAESVPQKKFRRKHLMARLRDAIEILKEAVKNKNLPSFIQPEKNLFKTLSADQQELVLCKLDKLVQMGFFYAVQSVFDMFSESVLIAHCCTKANMAILSTFPFEKQVSMYLTIYKLTCEEEEMILKLSLYAKFTWIYGINWFEDVSAINLHRQLAESDHYETSITIEHDLLKTPEKLHTDANMNCATFWFLGCFLRFFVMLCKIAKQGFDIAKNIADKVEILIMKLIRFFSYPIVMTFILFWSACLISS